MRPGKASLFASSYDGVATLRGIASAAFTPKGTGYDPRLRLRRRLVALRGGPNAIVVALAWATTAVRVRVLSNGTPSSEDVDRAIHLARGLTAVDDDPSEFLAMVRGHTVLGPLALRADVRLSSTPTVFESLAVAIIEQLVTGVEARASIQRLWRMAGEGVVGTRLVAAPTGGAVRRVPMWEMHAIGVGSRRAATLHAAAGRSAAIERLREAAPAEALEKLQSLPGVGPWTANAVVRNAFGWPDAVPVGDFHAPFTISAALGGRDDLGRDDPKAADDAMLELLAPFRPHRARVAVLFERPAPGARRLRLPRVDPHRREPWRY